MSLRLTGRLRRLKCAKLKHSIPRSELSPIAATNAPTFEYLCMHLFDDDLVGDAPTDIHITLEDARTTLLNEIEARKSAIGDEGMVVM